MELTNPPLPIKSCIRPCLSLQKTLFKKIDHEINIVIKFGLSRVRVVGKNLIILVDIETLDPVQGLSLELVSREDTCIEHRAACLVLRDTTDTDHFRQDNSNIMKFNISRKKCLLKELLTKF